MLILSSVEFSKLTFSKKYFKEYYQGVKQFGSRSRRSALIWVQTVCKGYQLLARKELKIEDTGYYIFQCNGRSGYFPRSFVREYKVEQPNLAHTVETEVYLKSASEIGIVID